MALVGIIANPAASKDIRRLVAQGRVVPDWEKVNILKRVLLGLEAVGIDRVAAMPDSSHLVQRARDDPNLTLDLELLFEAPPGLAFFDCGGVRLMLTILQGEERDHRTSVIYYKVSDIQSATTKLKAKGVSFVHEPQLTAKMEDHELWIGFLRDPDENLIGIMAEIPFE